MSKHKHPMPKEGDGSDRCGSEDVPANPPRIESRVLLGASAVVLIDHEGETYCLRRTRLGKLILTK